MLATPIVWQGCLLCSFLLLLTCIATLSPSNLGYCSSNSHGHTADDNFDSSAAHYIDDADCAPSIIATSLQEQLRAQRLLLDVLGNVTSGTISAASTLSLLRDVRALRASLKHGAAGQRWAALKARARQRKPATRGVLIVAGGMDQFMNAHILLQLLRHPKVNCRLPAELVYYGASEYSALVADAVTAHAVATGTTATLVDGSKALKTMNLEPHKPLKRITGFRAKVHALTFVTKFDEVLLLDSDNTPLADPSYLFNTPAFAAHGNMFWLDFWTNKWMQSVLYSILGLDVPWETDAGFRASESGQLVVNRVLHYDVLEYSYLLNLHSSSGTPGAANGVVGSCLWGDKDTYPIAFSLAGKAQALRNVQHKPMQALSKRGDGYVHAGMVQRGVSGELLFLHKTAAGKLWPHCAVHGSSTCVLFGITTPVDQQQLSASVQDATQMEFEEHHIDLQWQATHCSSDEIAASVMRSMLDDDTVVTTATEMDAVLVDSDTVAGSRTNQLDSCHNRRGDVLEPCRKATTVACDLESSVGRLPIPVITVGKLPQQVQEMVNLTHKLFLDSLQLTDTQM